MKKLQNENRALPYNLYSQIHQLFTFWPILLHYSHLPILFLFLEPDGSSLLESHLNAPLSSVCIS